MAAKEYALQMVVRRRWAIVEHRRRTVGPLVMWGVHRLRGLDEFLIRVWLLSTTMVGGGNAGTHNDCVVRDV